MRTTNPMKSLAIFLRSLQTDLGDENNWAHNLTSREHYARAVARDGKTVGRKCMPERLQRRTKM